MFECCSVNSTKESRSQYFSCIKSKSNVIVFSVIMSAGMRQGRGRGRQNSAGRCWDETGQRQGTTEQCRTVEWGGVGWRWIRVDNEAR